MSQAKVDAYKAAKKTRKADIAKQKKNDAIRKIVYWVIAAVLVCALVVGLVITIKNISTKNSSANTYAAQGFELGDYADIQGTKEAAEDAE